ncbi:ABC-2 family transporter protein [Patescibacteria group bacterium]|nr:ABC-2 family transporter protein [Patescibacteria group bacterium]
MNHIKKHLNLIIQSIKIQTMDKLEVALAFTFITLGIILQFTITIIFFKAIYLRSATIGGWDVNQVYILLGTYFIIQYISWSTYIRGFNKISRFIENGELDLYLSKPVNLKFFLSYRYIDPIFIIPQITVAIGLLFYGVSQTNADINILSYLFILACAFIIHFSLIVIISSINFFTIIRQVDHLHNTIFKLGQYPITIYKGFTRLVLSIIIPIAFIYSVPARAMVGDLSVKEILATIGITFIFYFISSLIWNLGLKRYESAHG